MNKLVLAAAAASALVLAACGLSDPDSVQFAFSLRPLGQDSTPATSATVQTDTGAVVVSGYGNTPCVDQGVTMHGTRSGNDLQVTLQRQSLNGCSGGARWFAFSGVLYLPSGGTYHLTFSDQTGNSPVTLIDQDVIVKE